MGGFRAIETGVIELEAAYAGFDDCWTPLTYGTGPVGRYLAAQPEGRKAAIRDAYFELLGTPSGPFALPARVIAVRGRV